MAKELSLNDLNDDLVLLIINQLPALFQVAVTRVCSRFKKVAFKITKILDVYDIPCNQRIGIAKMIRLKSVRGLNYIDSDGEDSDHYGDSDDEEHQVMKTLGVVNPNITSFKGPDYIRGIDSLVTSYVKSVKCQDQAYTGSKLNFVFDNYHDYSNLIMDHPDLQLKRSMVLGVLEEDEDACDMANLEFESTNSARVTSILSRTINVTDLGLTIIPDSESFGLNFVLDSISNLPLKELELTLSKIRTEKYPNLDYHLNVKESVYSINSDDYKSLHLVFNIPSLRFVSFILTVDNFDHQAIYDSFIKSSNNRFNFVKIGMSWQKLFINSSLRHKPGFKHEINIDSLPSFDISTFAKKFKRKIDRKFKIICSDGRSVGHDCENLRFNAEFATGSD